MEGGLSSAPRRVERRGKVFLDHARLKKGKKSWLAREKLTARSIIAPIWEGRKEKGKENTTPDFVIFRRKKRGKKKDDLARKEDGLELLRSYRHHRTALQARGEEGKGRKG